MNPKKYRPELVVPAGDWPSLHTAMDQGADSVYFGVKGMNMRYFASNFSGLEMKKIVSILHRRNKKGYLALNVMLKENELGRASRIITQAAAAGVDAVILWDMALLSLAQDAGIPVHLSTQASVANSRSVAHYAAQGVQRIILARECGLDEIQSIGRFIKKEKIPCDLEVFIHGAMCLSVSGRCFLSQYSFGKSANRGRCEQPCRREYVIREKEGTAEYIVGQDYILSPRDLCALDFIDQLLSAGVGAFKIEGRMRSPEYVGVTSAVYREAIDRCLSGFLTPALKKKLKQRLGKVFNRGFSDGFYFGRPDKTGSRGPQHQYEKIYLGDVLKYYKRIGVAEIILRTQPLLRGQTVLVIGRNLPLRSMDVAEMQINHCPVERADKGAVVGVKVDFPVKTKEKVFLWKPRRPSRA